MAGMPDIVKVEKEALLQKLRANRDGHRAVFLKALDGFQKEVVQQLDRALADAKTGQRYRTYFNLPEPQDHTRDYDRVIEMIGMSVDDVIELNEYEFTQYVQDDWGWKPDFIDSTESYLAGRGR
jgi:carboxypeptidase C (cathepsin A)